jgi:hypothetical protein
MRNPKEGPHVGGHSLRNEIRIHKACKLGQRNCPKAMAFYDRPEEAFRKYITLDPESVEGAVLLNHHFVNQSASDIR